MQCNINQRGRMVRKVYGWLMLAAAAAVVLGGVMGWWSGPWVWIGASLLAAAGFFGWWEARKGWCAVRAMGIKTPV